MALAARSFHWVPNSDATLDGRWRRGNKPTVVASSLGIDLVAFNAANIVLTGLAPSAQSFNYRQYLTGTSSATATLSVNAASGSLGGWTISGSNLTNTGVVGNGSLFVSADDGAGTVVNFPIQSWSIVAVSTGYKAHRGNYAWNTGYHPNATTDDTFMASAGMAKFVGIQIEPGWSDLEGDTQGDYSKCDALLDSYLTKCQNRNKRLMVKMRERVFGTPSGSIPGGVFPAYARNSGMVVAPASGSGAGFQAIAAVWQDNCATAIQNLWTHILQRYDGNRYFEMACPYEETTINWTGLGGDHASAWYQVLKTNYTAWRKVASQTLLRFLCNFVEGDPALLSLFAVMKQLGGIAFGGPDPQVPNQGVTHYPIVVGTNYPSQFRTIQASYVFRGYQIANGVATQNYEDLGDHQIWVAEVQNLGIGYRSINSPTELLTYANAFQKAQYHVWDTYTGTDGTYKFSPDIVNAVNAVNGDGLRALPAGNWNTT